MRSLLAIYVLFLLVGIANSFVFSCNEVNYNLIKSKTEIPTRYICLAQSYRQSQCWFDITYLKNVYAQSAGISISFADLNGTCVEGTGAWHVVTDPSVNWNCGCDFSLIFSSSLPDINSGYFDDEKTRTFSTIDQHVIVSPDVGIAIHKEKCIGPGNVTIFTGVGNGEEEKCFLMKSWTCETFPDWLISFDATLTIVLDADVLLTVGYQGYLGPRGGVMEMTPLDRRVAVMSSGLSDNVQLVNSDLTDAYFTWKKAMVVTATCSPCIFDINEYAYLEYDNFGFKVFRNESTLTFPIKDYLNAFFVCKDVPVDNLGESPYNFVLDLVISDVVQPTDSEPTTDTTPLPIDETDPYCNCALDDKFGMPEGWDSTGIWLDIVIILDTSEAMGEQSLQDAGTLIESLIGSDDGDVLITDTKANVYTRIGLIAMSDQAEVLYNLNMTKNDKVLDKVRITKGVTEINVVDAFDAAQTVFNDGLTSNPDRVNTRQVIYYMTDSDPQTNSDSLNQFKTSSGIIIVNNFIEEGIERPGLKELASDGYYRSDLQENYMETIQLFCKANCFCRPDKEAYAGHTTDPAVKASGGCFNSLPVGVQFSKSKSNCDNLGGGRIASVHDANKAQFVQKMLIAAVPKAGYFWIGYSKGEDGSWRWEDSSVNPYTNWDKEEPSSASVAKCAYVDTATLYWGAGNCNVGFPSVCEFSPCSVGKNKC